LTLLEPSGSAIAITGTSPRDAGFSDFGNPGDILGEMFLGRGRDGGAGGATLRIRGKDVHCRMEWISFIR
jgi:hypothetical protein